MRNLFFILFLFIGQMTIAQINPWQSRIVPQDYNPKNYFISDYKIIKYYNDTTPDFSVEFTKERDTLFTVWKYNPNSEIKKFEVLTQKDSKNKIETMFYKNGDYETGLFVPYFKGVYRKGIWKLYDKKNKLIGFGRYKKYILLKDYKCPTGEHIEDDYKQGKWIYLDSLGRIQKIVKYRNGEIKSTKNIYGS